jgi:hypothetical protein
MMVARMALYVGLLFTLVWVGIIRFSAFWEASPLIVLLLLNICLFIPVGWGAPQGSARYRGGRTSSFGGSWQSA